MNRHLFIYKIYIFTRVMETKSQREVARDMEISQGSVSHHLSKLSDFFGERLFTVSKRRLVPTPFAETLYGKVEASMHDLGDVLYKWKAVTTMPAEEQLSLLPIGITNGGVDERSRQARAN